MQDEDEKELLRKLRDLQDENEHLRIENKKLKRILESFSVKPASFAYNCRNTLMAKGLYPMVRIKTGNRTRREVWTDCNYSYS